MVQALPDQTLVVPETSSLPGAAAGSSSVSPRGAKARQPFPKLPSFPVAATLLSYMGYAWQIKQLLHLLSKNGKNYWDNHREFLKCFVFFRESKPFFGIRELFYAPERCKYFQWPRHVDLMQFQTGNVRLESLELRTDRFLTGVRVALSAGERSAAFASPYICGGQSSPQERWHTVKVDLNQRVASFAMKVDIKSDGRIHYTGVRAKDAAGSDVFYHEWQSRGEWEQLDLSEDERIIGVHGYLHMDWQIIHLGLLLVSSTSAR